MGPPHRGHRPEASATCNDTVPGDRSQWWQRSRSSPTRALIAASAANWAAPFFSRHQPVLLVDLLDVVRLEPYATGA